MMIIKVLLDLDLYSIIKKMQKIILEIYMVVEVLNRNNFNFKVKLIKYTHQRVIKVLFII